MHHSIFREEWLKKLLILQYSFNLVQLCFSPPSFIFPIFHLLFHSALIVHYLLTLKTAPTNVSSDPSSAPGAGKLILSSNVPLITLILCKCSHTHNFYYYNLFSITCFGILITSFVYPILSFISPPILSFISPHISLVSPYILHLSLPPCFHIQLS